MEKTDIAFLQELAETPSVTGTEVAVASLVRERLEVVADEIQTDILGSVQASVYGTAHGVAATEADANADVVINDNPSAGASQDAAGVPTVMLAAHMDEIGLMVHYISDEGFLSISAVGGVDIGLLPGLRMDVHTESGVLRGVVSRTPIHLIPVDDRKNITPIDKLVIDLGLPAKDVHKRVRVGDTITYAVGFESFGKNLAVSRAFDDKAGVFVVCRVAEELAKLKTVKADYICCTTVQEEIGLRGGATSSYKVNPDVAIAIDVTHATDYPGIEQAKHGKIELGAGPVIARGPNINPVVFERLVAAAKKEKIVYQIEAEPAVTGTDAGEMQVQRGGRATGLVSLPLRYMHTPTEVISLDDIEAAIKLLVRFVRDLDEDVSFVPGM